MHPFPLQPGPKVQPAQLREGPRSCMPKKAWDAAWGRADYRSQGIALPRGP